VLRFILSTMPSLPVPPTGTDLPDAFTLIGLALGLGLLVGLQREKARSALAGIRTFALITVLGTLCALLGQSFEQGGVWVVALGFMAISLLLVIGNVAKLAAGKAASGLTTEVAALVMYGVGAYLVLGHRAVGIAVGGGVAVLLYWKAPLHDFVARIGDADFRAIMRFALIALVILPVLPDQAYGPYAVLNPRQIWWMVVLIVGIGLAGYVVYKLVGAAAGAALAGALGGLISSTATTVSFARRTRAAPGNERTAALIIQVASAVAFGRVLVEIGVVAPAFLPHAAPALGTMLALMAALAAGMYFLGRGGDSALPEPSNPAEIRPAVIFGVVYALILLAVAATRDHFGASGLYVVAIVSGLTDMDAVTLSTSRLVAEQRLAADLAWRLILIAALANLAFKGVLVAVLGSGRLFAWVGALFGTALAVGVLLVLFWPETPAPTDAAPAGSAGYQGAASVGSRGAY